MALNRSAAPLILTLGLSMGAFYATHEVNSLKTQADVINSCIVHAGQQACKQIVPSSAEVKTLQSQAETIGLLGWISFAGAVGSFSETLRLSRKSS